ncbi:MAG: uracil-DNA glycosylase [Christensenellales bacterium]
MISLKDKKKAWSKLKEDCVNMAAQFYADSAVVFGQGRLDANIVLIGEAPGAEEAKMGLPFVGKAGKNLDVFLETLELSRDDIYITNVVKIRPCKKNENTGRLSNRPPSKDEKAAFMPYLIKELEVIAPKLVVTLGNTALRVFHNITIGEAHGAAIEAGRFTVFPLYHPASIIYNRTLEQVYISDLAALKEYIYNSIEIK